MAHRFLHGIIARSVRRTSRVGPLIFGPFFGRFLRATAPPIMLRTKTKQCSDLRQSATVLCPCNDNRNLDNAGLRLTWLHGSDNRGMCVQLQLTGHIYCQAGTQESPLVQSIAQLTGIHKLSGLTNHYPARHYGGPTNSPTRSVVNKGTGY